MSFRIATHFSLKAGLKKTPLIIKFKEKQSVKESTKLKSSDQLLNWLAAHWLSKKAKNKSP